MVRAPAGALAGAGGGADAALAAAGTGDSVRHGCCRVSAKYAAHSSSRNCLALGKRSAGDFANARATTRSNVTGNPAFTFEGGGGTNSSTLVMAAKTFSPPAKGDVPVNSS